MTGLRAPNKNKKKRYVTWLCVLLSLLTGCGTKTAAEPELLEPVAGTESCRAVTIGAVGTLQVQYGSVVPTEYAQFWKTQVSVSEILVSVGDTVEEGQILAQADPEKTQETLDSLEESRALLMQTYELENQKHDLKVQELTLKQQGLAQLGDSSGADAAARELASEQENQSYDTRLYQHQLSDLDEQIAAQQEILDDGTLTATASGTVSFVKELAAGASVTASDNIVVIADYTHTYIQVNDVTIKDKLLDKYERYYTIMDGREIELKEYAYTAQEKLAAESQSKYPALRMQMVGSESCGEAGVGVPIYLERNRKEDVLLVGNDSLYEDEQGTFVYVNQDGEREQRYIETGTSDAVNTEVLSGLSEGEKVYYTSDDAIPDTYETYTVGASETYDATFYTSRYGITNRINHVCKSEYEGIVDMILVSQGVSVAKGDAVLTIRTNDGTARLAELQNNIDSVKANYETATASHAQTVQTLTQELATANAQATVQNPANTNTQPQTATDTDADAQTATGQTQAGNGQTQADSGQTSNTTDTQTAARQTTTEQTQADSGQTSNTTDTQTATGQTQANDAQEQAESVNPNQAEMIALEIQIENLDFEKQTLSYQDSLKQAQAEYDKASANNDGNGTVTVRAEYDGEIQYIWKEEGDKISADEDLFNVDAVTTPVFTLYGNNNTVTLGAKVTIKDKETGKTYTGMICGTNGESSQSTSGYYITTRDNRVYVTQSVTDNSKMYYVQGTDGSDLSGLSGSYEISYPLMSMDNVYKIPSDYLNTELSATDNGTDRTYVWKLVDGNLEKQYVRATVYTMSQDLTAYDDTTDIACIYEGLSEGDEIAISSDDIKE